MAARRGQRGVSLIEALVTLFILSIGMLGVAGLQSSGLRAGHSATLRSLAVFHSQEIVERMRANRAGLASYASAGEDKGCADITAAAKVCNATELALDDRYRWEQAVQAAFPGTLSPDPTITVDTSVTPAAVTVSITWTERKATQGGETRERSYESRLLL